MIEPLIAMKRERHIANWKARFAGTRSPPGSATPMRKMAHRLKTKRGKELYALRKQTPEPVFGIIKSVMGSGSSCCEGSRTREASGIW